MEIVTKIAPIALALIMLGLGLGLKIDDFKRVITNPKAVYLTTEIFTDNQISDEDAKNRLKEMVDETLQLASKLKK